MSKTFALIGAAGYVAPRHMAAILGVGGELVAALDPHDSVGILDSYAPDCLYFREPERFDRWLSRHPVDYVVVCSPNHLHASHCLMAMRNGADVICEKPLVLREHNLDNLAEWEQRTGRRVNVILQCRLHPETREVEQFLSNDGAGTKYDVSIKYSVRRGPWYDYSWKGNRAQSGGVVFNIGIHLIDLAIYLFGKPHGPASVLKRGRSWCAEKAAAYWSNQAPRRHHGRAYLERAVITWELAVAADATERSFNVRRICQYQPGAMLSGGVVLDLNNISNRHLESYVEIVSGNGFGIEDIRPATRLAEMLSQPGEGN